MSRLATALAALETMSPAQFGQEWQRLYGAAAPRLSPDLLRMGIGYRLQESGGRGLSAAALRLLREPAAASPRQQAIGPGTQLVRTWHGRTISVVVEADGFRFDGRCFTSLSAIAREVTGTAWSGPRFFGLGVAARG